MTMNNHVCDGTTFIAKSYGKSQIVRFECPSCHQSFYPLNEIDAATGAVHWFAALPSKQMQAVAKSGNIVQNLLAIHQQNPALYERILFVRTDP